MWFPGSLSEAILFAYLLLIFFAGVGTLRCIFVPTFHQPALMSFLFFSRLDNCELDAGTYLHRRECELPRLREVSPCSPIHTITVLLSNF